MRSRKVRGSEGIKHWTSAVADSSSFLRLVHVYFKRLTPYLVPFLTLGSCLF